MGFKYRFPPLEEYTLANGMCMIWLPEFEQSVVTVALQLPVGRYTDPVGREGISELLFGLMQKGTQERPGEAFARALENAGASLFVDVGDEHVTLGVRMLQAVAERIVPLFWEMVTRPSLDPGELKRLKKEMITGMQAEYADPSVLAAKHFQVELFGSAHPAGHLHTIRSVKRVELHDIRGFYTQHVRPEGGVLVVAGAMSADAMRRQWESLFADWTVQSNGVAVVGEKVPPLAVTRVRLIDKPDLSQTTVVMGHPCVGELDDGRMSLSLGNYILGGGNFSSRLMKKVRSDAGRTYGISSDMSCHRRHGTFMISTSTQSTQLGDVLGSILEVYHGFCGNGVEEEELGKAKRFAEGNIAFELEGLGNVVDKLLWLKFHGRSHDYIESYASRLASVDCAHLNTALKEKFYSEHFTVVAVGRREDVEAQISSLGEIKHVGFRSDP